MKKHLLISVSILASCFNLKAQVWSALGSGMIGNYYAAGSVLALTTHNNTLIAGGIFSAAGGKPVSNIAQWNGTSWSALGSGVNVNTLSTNNYEVGALIVYNGNVIAGGAFDTAGGNLANNIAQWNGATWSALSSGINGEGVGALTIYNSNLIAGGVFSTAGGNPANNIAQWNGTTWSALGTGVGSGSVNALTVYNGNLIAAGFFDSAGGKPANNIAQWNGTTWSVLGAGLNHYVNALAVYNGNLIAAGCFDSAGGKPVNYIAQWNGTTWSGLGLGLNNLPYALTTYNNELIAGGQFFGAGGKTARYIAEWNDTNWSALGIGMDTNIVFALTVYNSSLIAGGAFDSAGGVSANNIAQWNVLSGINELNSDNGNIIVYPNPSNGIFNLQSGIKNYESKGIEVYNMLGEKIYSQSFSIQNSTFKIDISSQPAGIYLYRVTSEKGELVGSGKLVIE